MGNRTFGKREFRTIGMVLIQHFCNHTIHLAFLLRYFIKYFRLLL